MAAQWQGTASTVSPSDLIRAPKGWHGSGLAATGHVWKLLGGGTDAGGGIQPAEGAPMLPRAFHSASSFQRLFADGDVAKAKTILRSRQAADRQAAKGTEKGALHVGTLSKGAEAGLQGGNDYKQDTLSAAAGTE